MVYTYVYVYVLTLIFACNKWPLEILILDRASQTSASLIKVFKYKVRHAGLVDPYVPPSHPSSVTSLMNMYQVYQIVLILKLALCVCDCKGELYYVYVISVDTGNSVEASPPISVGGVTLQDLLLYGA